MGIEKSCECVGLLGCVGGVWLPPDPDGVVFIGFDDDVPAFVLAEESAVCFFFVFVRSSF